MNGKLTHFTLIFLAALLLLVTASRSMATSNHLGDQSHDLSSIGRASSSANQSERAAGEGLRVVVLYRQDVAGAEATVNLLNSNGFTASSEQVNEPFVPAENPVYLPLVTIAGGSRLAAAAADVPDFADVDLIIIGPDTGTQGTWNPETGVYEAIQASGKPVVGIGEGGYAYFGRVGLAIGYPNGSTTLANSIEIADFGASQRFYEKPNAITIPANETFQLYNGNRDTVAIQLDAPIPDGVRLAALADVADQFPIVTEGDNLLWGFDGSLADLTADGQQLFINALSFEAQEIEVELKGRTFTPGAGVDPTVLAALEAQAPIHVMIQLESLPSVEDRESLENTGVTLLDYIGKTLYQAVLSDGFESDDPAVLDLVRWMGLFEPADKIDPKIGESGYEDWAANGDGTVNVLVTVFSDVADDDAEEIIMDYADSAEVHAPHTWATVIAASQVDDLLAEDVVSWVEEGPAPLQIINDVMRSDLNVDSVQNANINSGSIYYNGLDGSGVNVAVFDSGLFTPTLTHNDYTGRVLRTATDTNGHGTHVAGIIGASGANSVSNCPTGTCTDFELRGMAPGIKVAPYYGWDNTIWDEAINTHDVEVSNHSYIQACSGYNGNAQAIDSLVRGDLTNGSTTIPQHSVVWAAANQGTGAQWCTTATVPDGPDANTDPDPDPTSGPRGYFSVMSQSKNSLTIGGYNRGTTDLTGFSSRGPTWDGRLKPDVMAPSCSYSLDNDTQGYVWSCGTSMSSPAAAGVVALITQQYHETFPSAGRPMPSTIKAVLTQTAIDMVHHPGQAGFSEYGWNDPDTGQPVIYHEGPDWATGYGMIDAQAAVAAIRGRSFIEGTVQPGDMTQDYTITINDRDQLKFTLAWDDEPGNPALAHNVAKLVNDLDLTLIDPNGIVYQPLVLSALPRAAYNASNADDGTPDPIVRNTHILAAAPGVDRLNNVEQVIVDNPIDGTWTIRVNAFALPNSNPQEFSLAGDFRALNIVTPQTGDEADAGDPSDPNVVTIVLEAESTGAGGGISTMADAVAADFQVEIEGTPAQVISGLPVGDQFWLNVVPATGTYTGGVRYDLEVTWTGFGSDSETNAILFTEKLVTDRAVVIDYSWSMNDYDKMAAAKSAARLFVDRSLANDRIAVTGFSTAVTTPYATTIVTNNPSTPELNAAKAAIDSFTPTANTAIGLGLLEGQAQVTASPADYSERDVILLLSDGMENVTPYYDTPAVKGVIEPTQTIIHTVSVGPASAGHHSLLEDIADDNGGDNYPVTADSSTRTASAVSSGIGIDAWPTELPNRLGDVYAQIADDILYENRLFQASGYVDPSKRDEVYNVFVPEGLKRLTVAANWSNEFHMLALELTDPSGQVFIYDQKNPECRNDTTHEVCMINSPEPGEWKIRLVYVETDVDNEFVLWVSAKTSIQFDLRVANDGSAIAPGEPVQLIGMLTQFGKPLTDQSIKVNVYSTPDFDGPTTIGLFDDGLHGDGEAGDGIYGGTFIGNEAGPYAARGLAAGEGADGVAYELYDNENFHLVPKAIYVYDREFEKGESYEDLIEANGMAIDLVHVNDVSSTNLDFYSLAIIGPGTGSLGTWGTDEAYIHIVQNELPQLGLGEGGYAYFGKVGLGIGFPNGAHGSGSHILGASLSDPIWDYPYFIQHNKEGEHIYRDPSRGVSIWLGDQPSGVEIFGFKLENQRYADIIMESNWFMLWGFNDGPDEMTQLGRELFVNTVYRTAR